MTTTPSSDDAPPPLSPFAGTRDPVALGAEARRIMRGAASAALATATEDGQPFASLATPAVAPDGTVLLRLSTLSEHTRQLMRHPRCSLLFAGAPETANPQTAPRVTVTGLAERVQGDEEPPLKARWLARHPYAALYADFGDFGLWRVRPGGALLVGGFARAHRLRASDLAPDPAAVAALAASEADVMGHVNEDHADALEAIAIGLLGGGAGPWRMTALDPDGCDLTRGEGEAASVLRLPFDPPVREAGGVRAALVAAARAGREALAARQPTMA